MARLAAATFVLALCFAAPAVAVEVFTATLSGLNENPPVVSDASGVATFTLNDPEDELGYQIDVTGLDWTGAIFGDTLINTPGDPTDDISGMHLHVGGPAINGPIVFGMFGPSHDLAFQSQAISSDTIRFTGGWDASDLAAEPLASHLANLRNAELYLNVHTPMNAGGEIRGQLVPEPSLAVLLGLSLLGVASRRAARVGA